jgi:phage gpG-like protein
MDLKISIDLKKVNQAFIKLGKEINNLEEPLKTAGGYMIREMTKNIVNAVDYKNKPFKKFKLSTLYYTKKDGTKTWKKRASGRRYSAQSKLLQDTGQLKQTLDFIQKQKLFIIIGSKKVYADYQNSMREYAGFNNNNKKRIQLIFDNYSKKIIKQAGLE